MSVLSVEELTYWLFVAKKSVKFDSEIKICVVLNLETGWASLKKYVLIQ